MHHERRHTPLRTGALMRSAHNNQAGLHGTDVIVNTRKCHTCGRDHVHYALLAHVSETGHHIWAFDSICIRRWVNNLECAGFVYQ